MVRASWAEIGGIYHNISLDTIPLICQWGDFSVFSDFAIGYRIQPRVWMREDEVSAYPRMLDGPSSAWRATDHGVFESA